MSHGSNPPPSRPCSLSRDYAVDSIHAASEPLRDNAINDRENAVIFGVGGRFQDRYLNLISNEVLNSSRRNMDFCDVTP